jgi:hypothetical protein
MAFFQNYTAKNVIYIFRYNDILRWLKENFSDPSIAICFLWQETETEPDWFEVAFRALLNKITGPIIFQANPRIPLSVLRQLKHVPYLSLGGLDEDTETTFLQEASLDCQIKKLSLGIITSSDAVLQDLPTFLLANPQLCSVQIRCNIVCRINETLNAAIENSNKLRFFSLNKEILSLAAQTKIKENILTWKHSGELDRNGFPTMVQFELLADVEQIRKSHKVDCEANEMGLVFENADELNKFASFLLTHPKSFPRSVHIHFEYIPTDFTFFQHDFDAILNHVDPIGKITIRLEKVYSDAFELLLIERCKRHENRLQLFFPHLTQEILLAFQHGNMLELGCVFNFIDEIDWKEPLLSLLATNKQLEILTFRETNVNDYINMSFTADDAFLDRLKQNLTGNKTLYRFAFFEVDFPRALMWQMYDNEVNHDQRPWRPRNHIIGTTFHDEQLLVRTMNGEMENRLPALLLDTIFGFFTAKGRHLTEFAPK